MSAALAHAPTRLQKLVALLGSDNDAEVLATVRAIRVALHAEGRDFHDLAATIGYAAPRVASIDPAPRCSLPPTWAGMSGREKQAWAALVLASPSWAEPNLYKFARRARAGQPVTSHWSDVRQFNAAVADLFLAGARV